MEYYIINIVYKDESHYCIWTSDEEDKILTENRRIIRYAVLDDLYIYADKHNILFNNNEIMCYNFDNINNWCVLDDNYVDCREVLNIWNILSDIARGLETTYIGDCNEGDIDILYEKLFYGNNLPSINYSEKVYKPVWSKNEIQKLKSILINGLQIFSDGIMKWENVEDR